MNGSSESGIEVTEYYCYHCGWTEPVYQAGDPALCSNCDGEYEPSYVYVFGDDGYAPPERLRTWPRCGEHCQDYSICDRRTDGGPCWQHEREAMTDGGTVEDGTDRPGTFDIPLGPHRIPRIDCETCGESHHPDTARSIDDLWTHCNECGAFLRQPTPTEEQKFGWFMIWNGNHLDRDEPNLMTDGGTVEDGTDRSPLTASKMDPQNDEYATPPKIWRPLSRAVGGFDVDPASGAESTPIASTRYTKEDDGLSKAWYGDVWLNPPWSTNGDGSAKETWLRKARNEANRDDVNRVLVVLPSDTSAHWFHDHVTRADSVCFVGPGRIAFEGGDRNPSFGLIIAVFGPVDEDLADALDTLGIVVCGRSIHDPNPQTALPDGGRVEDGTDQIEVTEYYCYHCGWTEPVYQAGDPALCSNCDGEYEPSYVYVFGDDGYAPPERLRTWPRCGENCQDYSICDRRTDGGPCWQHEREAMTDGGTVEDGTDQRCQYCEAENLVYNVGTDRGSLTTCIECLCVKRAQPQIGWEGFQDYPEHLQKGVLEDVNDYLTIIARIRQDDPVLKRDPDVFGTVSENCRTFIVNIMGSAAHYSPSEIIESDGDPGQQTLTDGGNVEDGTDRRVYLAGPIDQSDDPWGWRDRAKDLAPDGVEMVDPMDRFADWPEDPTELIEFDLRMAASCDVLAGAMGSVPTTGTHYEIERALMNGNTVVVHLSDRQNVSKFLLERPGVEFTEDLEQAVQMVCQTGKRGVPADD